MYVCSSCYRLKTPVNNSFPVAIGLKIWHIVLPEDDKIVQKYVGDEPFILALTKIMHLFGVIGGVSLYKNERNEQI
jgi:hypothetical protein